MANKNIANISFIDLTQGNETADTVYCLNSDASADTLGVFTTEEKVIEAIDKAIESGENPQNLWGVIYPLDTFIVQ